jgi:uncharacterized protein (TIGR02147 family)
LQQDKVLKVVQRIQDEFERRRARNHRYSMRTYARFLGIEVSMLSRVLQGKLPFTKGMLNKASIALLFSPDEYLFFEKEITEKKDSKKGHSSVIPQIDQEQFKIIQDWYHFVILELASLPDFEATGEWVSNKLGISLDEAQLAIERLVRLEFLIEKDGRVMASSDTSMTSLPPISTVAMRNRQKQVLEKSSESIEFVNVAYRDHSAITISIDSKLIPEIKERIKKFRRSMAKFIDNNSKKKDNVYELSISFFPWIK